MKLVNSFKKTNPSQLLREGKTWLSVWENTKDKSESFLPIIYCLFTALEFYMKAYLVLKDSEYSDTSKLKDLGHNFGNIYDKIIASERNNLTKEINSQINKYELRNIALDRLKYPDVGGMWLLSRGLEKKEHTLVNIFQEIDKEITSNFDDWLIATYPKETQIGAMTQIGYEGNLEEIDLKTFSNTCSECLPANIIIFEDYNYPWGDELISDRNCVSCEKLFNPKGMRPSIR